MKMDILSVLEHKFPSFSKGQRTIAQFILKNYDKAAFMTAARNLARFHCFQHRAALFFHMGAACKPAHADIRCKFAKCVTGVSESTVVRFAADLGYRGYPGMKKALQEIVRNRLTSVERIEAAESTMDGHDVLKAVLRADINNLQATLDEIDQDYFNQAVDMILSAKHIYIIGMRTSTTLADFLAIYLKLLLDNVTVVKEIAAREVYEQLLRIGEGDLIIGISFPRYSKRTISAMKFARDRGARCLGLTDGKVSPLNEISDVCLYTKSEMVSFLDSLVAPLSMINALIMAVSARDRTRTFETFRELENVWKEYEVYGTVES